MIHVDTLKRIALYAVLFFFAWNWAAAEIQVRNLTHVGNSMGQGWSQYMTVLEPRLEGLEAFAARAVGLSHAEDEDR